MEERQEEENTDGGQQRASPRVISVVTPKGHKEPAELHDKKCLIPTSVVANLVKKRN